MAESDRQVQGKFGSIVLSDSLLALFLDWNRKEMRFQRLVITIWG